MENTSSDSGANSNSTPTSADRGHLIAPAGYTRLSGDRWGMFSVGALTGFLVGMLVLVTALISLDHVQDSQHPWDWRRDDMHGSMHGQMPDQMYGQMPNQMYGQMPNQMYGQMPDQMHGPIPGDPRGSLTPDESHSKEDALKSWESELARFEDFINNEREMFKKRLAALPKEQQSVEQKSFDSWLKDRQQEFYRNNPKPQ